METHIRVVHSETPRNTTDAESSASTSDKENKLEVAQQLQHQPHPHQQQLNHFHQMAATSSSTATLINLSTMSEAHPIPTSSAVYETYTRGVTSSPITSPVSTNSPNAASVILSMNGHQQLESADLRSFAGSSFYSRMSPTMAPSGVHHREPSNGGLNSALLAAAAAAAANDELAMSNYHSQRQHESHQHMQHPSRFQIPAAAHYHRHALPSPSSESSRSSPSPKLEIVEPEPPVYMLPDYAHEPEALMMNGSSSPSPSSVIIQVPYADGRTPSSSTSTSPVPSSPELVDVVANAKDELCLPPRKRTKMILKSMEEDRESANFRYNSVIQYAKASQIFHMH